MNSTDLVLRELSKKGTHASEILSLLDAEISLPNIPMPTMGGEVFWNTLSEYGGWKLQQNMITHHARILNDCNVRVAWGTVNGMLRAMDRLAGHLKNNGVDTERRSKSSCRLEAMEELEKLKKLFDMGAITEQEYNEKKKSLLSKF